MEPEFEECIASKSKKVYYRNKRTGISTWKIPPSFLTDKQIENYNRKYEKEEMLLNTLLDMQQDAQVTALSYHENWSSHESSTGLIYYYHHPSGKSTWTYPSDFEDASSLENGIDLSAERELQKQNIVQFRNMLKDHKVCKNDTWDSILPRIAVDKRFTLIKT